MKKYKLAILAPNLTPNLPPFYRKIGSHSEVELMVYICSDYGIVPTTNPMFNRDTIIKWDEDVLRGYHYEILENYGFGLLGGNFFGLINPSIFRELWRNKYSALLIFGYARFSSWLAVLAAWFTNTPVFFAGESSFKQEMKRSKLKRWLKGIILGKFFFKMIKVFFYLGEENWKFYRHYGIPSSKLFFFPYAANNDELVAAAQELQLQKASLRKEINLGPEEVVILFCGKLSRVKQPLDLLRAYEKLLKDNPGFDGRVALIFVGEGVLRRGLKDYAQDRHLSGVYFVGFKNYKEVRKFYALADIFVLPSASETWGMVVNEAMCFSLPVVVSDAVGCGPDLVKENENGFIYPTGSIEELTLSLKELIIDGVKREKFGWKSLKIIHGYSYLKDVEGVLDALRHLGEAKVK